MFTDFGKKATLGKLVAMATKKHLSLIYELEDFANTYLGKVTKFQGDGLFPFLSSEQFTGLEVENNPPPPPRYE